MSSHIRQYSTESIFQAHRIRFTTRARAAISCETHVNVRQEIRHVAWATGPGQLCTEICFIPTRPSPLEYIIIILHITEAVSWECMSGGGAMCQGHLNATNLAQNLDTTLRELLELQPKACMVQTAVTLAVDCTLSFASSSDMVIAAAPHKAASVNAWAYIRVWNTLRVIGVLYSICTPKLPATAVSHAPPARVH